MRSIPKHVASSEAARHVRAVLWLTILVLLFGAQSAPAQEAGSIQGKVTDSSGAPISARWSPSKVAAFEDDGDGH